MYSTLEDYNDKNVNSVEELEINPVYEYEDVDINRFLELIVKENKKNNECFARVEVLGAVDNIYPEQLQQRLEEAKSKYPDRILLIPYNLGNYHWVGILVVLSLQGEVVRALCFDPLRIPQPLPSSLKAIAHYFNQVFPLASLQFMDFLLQPDLKSCGVVVIEGLLRLVTLEQIDFGKISYKLSQEEIKAIRLKHLQCVKCHDESDFVTFYQRQLNNNSSVTNLDEQLQSLYSMQEINFSSQEKKCIAQVVKEIREFESNDIRQILQQALNYKEDYEREPNQYWQAIRQGFNQVLSLAPREELTPEDQERLKYLLEFFFDLTVNDLSVLEDIGEQELRLSYEMVKAIDEVLQSKREVDWQQMARKSTLQIQTDEALTRKIEYLSRKKSTIDLSEPFVKLPSENDDEEKELKNWLDLLLSKQIEKNKPISAAESPFSTLTSTPTTLEYTSQSLLSENIQVLVNRLREAHMETEPNYREQAELFIELGDYYQSQQEYLYAAGIYNYVLNLCKIKLHLNEQHETVEGDEKSKIVKTMGEIKTDDATQGSNTELGIQPLEQQVRGKLIVLEEQFLIYLNESVSGVPMQNLYPYLEVNSKHKETLAKCREYCKQQLAIIEKQYPFDIYDEDKAQGKEKEYQALQLEKAKMIYELYHRISEEMKNFICQLVQECIATLGKSPCEYAIIGLGSLAREEATPYSDLEFAILIEEEIEHYKEYFRNLTKLMHMKVINLGETILPSLAIPVLNNYYSNDPLENWFYDSISPRGFSFDGAMPHACKTPLGKKDAQGKQIYELIHTPEEMAKFQAKKESNNTQSPYWFEVESHLSNVLYSFTWIAGNEALISNYAMSIEKALNKEDELHVSLRKKQGLKLLQKDILEFNPNIDDGSEEGKLYIVKKEIYRLLSIIIDRLALYLGIEKASDNVGSYTNRSSHHRLDKLKQADYINELAVSNIKIAIGISIELRLRAYLENGMQQENMAFCDELLKSTTDNNDAIKRIFYLPDIRMLFRFYYTVLPFHKKIVSLFCNKSPDALDINSLCQYSFFDSGKKIKGLIYKRLLQYQQAIEYLEEAIGVSPKDANSLFIIGEIFAQLGRYKEALKKYKEACRIFIEKEKYHYVIITLSNTAIIYDFLSKYKKAWNAYENILVYYKVLGSIIDSHTFKLIFHREIAHSLSNLGVICAEMGKYKKGLFYHQQALALREKYYCNQPHYETSISLNNIGSCMVGLSDYWQAKKYFEKSLNIRRKLYGNQINPHLAIALLNLAVVWSHLGNHIQALSYYKDSLNVLISFYGENQHPEIANTYIRLGRCWREFGEYQASITCYEKALAIQEKFFSGSLPPDSAKALENLGDVYLTLGNYQRANTLFQKASNIYDQFPLDKRSEGLFAFQAGNLSHQGKYQEAITYCKKAINTTKLKYQGILHPKLIIYLNELSRLLTYAGLYQESIRYCEESLKLSENLYGILPHENKETCLAHMATAHYKAGHYLKAINLYEQALEMNKVLHKIKSHPRLAIHLDNLSEVYRVLGQFNQAYAYQEQTFSLRKALWGDRPHLDIAMSLNNFGNILLQQGKYPQAASYHKQALKMRQQIFKFAEGHPDIATSLSNLGVILNIRGKYQKAYDYHQKALIMRCNFFKTQPHPDVADSWNNLGIAVAQLERFSEALVYHEKALSIRREVYNARRHKCITR